MANGAGKIYKNKRTGQVIRWSGGRPPSSVDLDLAANQLRTKGLGQVADIQSKVPSWRSEFLNQLKVNAPSDLGKAIGGIGGMITDPITTAYHAATHPSETLKAAFQPTQDQPGVGMEEAAESIPVLGSAITFADPLVRTALGIPGANKRIGQMPAAGGALAGAAMIGAGVKGLQSLSEARAPSGMDISPSTELGFPRKYAPPPADVNITPSQMQRPQLGTNIPQLPAVRQPQLGPGRVLTGAELSPPVARSAAEVTTGEYPTLSPTPIITPPPSQIEVGPSTLPQGLAVRQPSILPKETASSYWEDPMTARMGQVTPQVRPPSPEVSPLPAPETIPPDITPPELESAAVSEEPPTRSERGKLLRTRNALKKSQEITKLPPGPEDPELAFDQPKSKLRTEVERLWSEETGSLKISGWKQSFGSMNKALRKSGYEDIAQVGEDSQDAKGAFIARALESAAKATKGLDTSERKQTWEILNTHFDPERARGQYPDKIVNSAVQQRAIFQKIHSMFPERATKYDTKAGFIPNYITHMKSLADSDSEIGRAFNEVWQSGKGILSDLSDFFVSGEEERPVGKSEPVQIHGTPWGRPKSPFVEFRSGKLTTLEKDPNRIWPTYVHSAGKVIFDLPAVRQIRAMSEGVVEPSAREEVKRFGQSIAGYVDDPIASSTLNRVTSILTKTLSRSVLGFSPQLQELHLGRIANVFTDLGGKYLGEGILDFLKNPKSSIDNARRVGLLPQSSTPFKMKTFGGKLDAVLYFMDMGNALVRSIGYNGYLKQAIDKGLGPGEASADAIRRLKESDQFIDSARAIPAFQKAYLKPFLQFKYIPAKMMGQIADVFQDWRNPLKLSRMVGGYLFMAYLSHKYGLRLIHLDPRAFLEYSMPLERSLKNIITPLAKGNFEKAADNLAKFLIPSGEQYNKGYPVVTKPKGAAESYQVQ